MLLTPPAAVENSLAVGSFEQGQGKEGICCLSATHSDYEHKRMIIEMFATMVGP